MSSRCSGATTLDTASAASGPSTRQAYPPVARVASRSARRGDPATSLSTSATISSAFSSDQVTSHASPSGPCSAWTTRSTAARTAGVDGPATTTTSDGPAKADATPTAPDTCRLASATYRLPGPTTTSTGAMDSVP